MELNLKHPKPDENYDCDVFCGNYTKIERAFDELESRIEEGGSGGSGATEEQLAQIEQNKNDIEELQKGKADKSEIPSLNGYATESFVEEYAQPKGNYLTEHQSLADYAKKSEIPTDYAKSDHKHSEYLTQHQSLAGYAKTADHYTKTESDGKYQPKGNYLTQHQDISGKADKATTLAGYGITDGATKTELSAIQEEIDDYKSEVQITKGTNAEVAENVVAKASFVDAYIAYNNGTEYVPTTDGKYVSTLEYYEIPEGARVLDRFTGGADRLYRSVMVFYDENKNYLSGIFTVLSSANELSQYNGMTVYEYDIPQNAKFFRFSVTPEASSLVQMYVVSTKPVGGKVEIPNLVIDKTRLDGKTCVCFGDSVTGNMVTPNDYPTQLGLETGMNVVNGGFGGCRMTDTHPDTAYKAFSMVKLADAVATGDWSLQVAQVGNISVVTNGVEHLSALRQVDWSKVDYATIAFGANDATNGITIDNESNKQDTKTYLGALRYSLNKIWSVYPQIKVLLLTPIYCYWIDEGVDNDSKMVGGKHYYEWGDSLFTVAKEYKIPCVDMYRTLGFNALNRGYYFPSTDGAHPNAYGCKAIASKVAGALLSGHSDSIGVTVAEVIASLPVYNGEVG